MATGLAALAMTEEWAASPRFIARHARHREARSAVAVHEACAAGTAAWMATGLAALAMTAVRGGNVSRFIAPHARHREARSAVAVHTARAVGTAAWMATGQRPSP